MDLESNNIALYLFLFLSLLSVGNDFYQVYLNTLDTDFVKKQSEKVNNYYEVLKSVLCNNVKKVKNKLIVNENNEIIKNENQNQNEIIKNENQNEIIKNENQNNEIIKLKNENQNETKNQNNEIIKLKNKNEKEKKRKKQKKNEENNIIDEKNNNEYEKNINILKTIVKKTK
jgi:hypothetical protein